MSHFYTENDKTRSNFNKNFFAAVKERLFKTRKSKAIKPCSSLFVLISK